MTTVKRFLWGGIGGLAPILATFLILEGEVIGRYLRDLGSGGSLLTLVGYSVRVLGLFIVGGLWASLHRSERDPKKLFQLGIVAPAMITGVLNASNVQFDPAPPPTEVSATSPAPTAPSSSPRSKTSLPTITRLTTLGY